MRGITKGTLNASTHFHTRRKILRISIWIAVIGFIAIAIWCLILYSLITRFEGVPMDNENPKAD